MHGSESVCAIGFGWTFFSCVFLLSRALLRRKAELLGIGEPSIHTISARVVSGAQGTLACVAGTIVTMSCHDVMMDRHWLAGAYVWFGATYLYFDTCVWYIEYHLLNPGLKAGGTLHKMTAVFRSDPAMTIHHLILPLFILPIVSYYRQGIGDYFLGCFMFVELVLPFKAFRDVAFEVKRTDTAIYRINAVLLVASFLASRILIFPFTWWSYGAQFNINTWEVPAHIPLKCNIGCLIYFILNINFLMRIYAQAKLELTVMFNKWQLEGHRYGDLRRKKLR